MKRTGKKLLCAGLALLLAALCPVASLAAWANPFRDVKPGDWYYSAVEYASTTGLFNGTAPDRFSPDDPITRGMFVTVLGRFAQIDPDAYPGSSFSDVSPGAYYAPYVKWAAQSNVVTGTSDTTFSPDDPITREQMATMLGRYAILTGSDTTFNMFAPYFFLDAYDISSYAISYMAWAVTHEVLQGDDGYLDPLANASRAQTVKVFYNARELLTTQVQEPQLPQPPAQEEEDPLPAEPDWLEEERRELEGGTRTLSDLGVTREALVAELTAHQSDRYYRSTPYEPGDWQSPNGDTSYNGQAGMNCGGFISYVLRKVGLDADRAMAYIRQSGDASYWGSGGRYDLLSGASNYRALVKGADLEAYVFASDTALLRSGKAEKGDIIFIDKGPNAKPGDDTHIGFYWGNGSRDVMWHSGGGGNGINIITNATSDPVYILIKID